MRSGGWRPFWTSLLASLLILNENATVASLLHGLYTAALNEVSHSYGAGIAPIREVY